MTDPASYGGTWYAAGMAAAPERGRLTVETDIDVCVIGGGLAGLTAAREVARRGWSVALIEAQRIAWNASGRNLGFVLPGFAADPEAIVGRVGLDHAKALWALSVAGAEYLRQAIRECRMPGVEYGASGWLNVSKTDNHDAVAARAAWLAETLGAAVDFWPVERVRATLNSPLYFSAVHHRRGFTINPLNYALGLAAAAEAAGARLYEMTPALELDPHGVRKRIVTPQARLRARAVVIAGNVQIGALVPKLAGTLIPISPYTIVTAPLGEGLREAIGFRGAVSDTERGNNHYRIVGGDRLMWSGHATVWRGDPRRRVKALTADIARAYPQLGHVTADHAWTGTLGHPINRMPQLGELWPGVWLAGGFGGHGLNTTAMAGELIARAIVEGDDTWRLFEPFELVWTGGVLGRAVAQVSMWSFGQRERLENVWARRREAKRAAAPAQQTAPVDASVAVAAVAEPETPPPDRSSRKRKKPKRKKASVMTPATAPTPEIGTAASVDQAVLPGDAPTPNKQSVGGVG